MQCQTIYDYFININGNDAVDAEPENFEEPWRTIFLLTERGAPVLGGPVALRDSIAAVAKDEDEEKRLLNQIYAASKPLHFPTLEEIGDNLKPVEWLWDGWIPRGMLSILGAFPGTGKSFLALDLCRCVISGPAWPDGSPIEAIGGTCIYVEAEGIPQVTNERALRMNVDRSKIRLVMAKDDEIFDLTQRKWRDYLVDLVAAVKPQLIIIDSLSSISTKSQNSVEDTTGLLMFLVALARQGNCGLLVLHHLRKPASGSLPVGPVTIHDFRGSGHIIAMARSVLGLGVIQKGKQFSLDGQRRLDIAKTNLGPYPPGIGVDLIEDDDTSRFEYGDALPWEDNQPNHSDTCGEWLLDYLAENGPTQPSEIVEDASEHGFNRRVVYRSRKKLGDAIINTKRSRHPANKWALPGQIDDEDDEE